MRSDDILKEKACMPGTYATRKREVATATRLHVNITSFPHHDNGRPMFLVRSGLIARMIYR